MIREKRKRKKRILLFVRILLMLALVFGIMFLIAFKVFTVKNVVVEGNVLYASESIQEVVLNDEYSWNSLYVFLKYKFVDTDEIPFVDTMEISLDDPHTLHINVYEKGMMGYIYIPGINENAYFDKDGIVVETSSNAIVDVPRIDGISCDEVVLYEKLPIKSSDLKNILSLTQALKRKKLIPDAITYGIDNAPVLTYGDVSVLIGDTTLLTKKVERLSTVMPSLSGMSGTLHLEDWNEENTNIVFQKNE